MNIKFEIKNLLRYDRALIIALLMFLISFSFLSDIFVKAEADWYGDGWGYRKKITIQASQVDANFSNFPIAIDVMDDDLRNVWSGGFVDHVDGGDFVFTAADGITKLPHEIEYYYFNSGTLTAWVKIPNLSSQTNTDIYLYYGNSTIGDQWSTDGSVWTGSGYSTVHHLGNNCSSSNCYKDSTDPAFGNNGTPFNGDILGNINDTNANIGYGLELDGNNDYLKINDIAELDLTDDFTIEVWAKLSELSRFNTIFDKGAYSLKVDPDKKIIFGGRINAAPVVFSEVASIGTDLSITSMAVFDGYLYATAFGSNATDSGVYRSSDGVNWSNVRLFSVSLPIGGLTVFKDYIYIFAGDEIFRSSNGTVWSTVYVQGESFTTLAVFENYLYAGIVNNGAVDRTVTGAVWANSQNFNPADVTNVLSMTVFDGELFVGGDHGKIMKTADGSTWSVEKDFAGDQDITALGVFDGKLWAGVDSGVAITTYYKSGPSTWTESVLP